MFTAIRDQQDPIPTMAEKEISPLDDAKLLGQAIANTESEIFRESTDQAEPEELGEGEVADRAREDMGDGLEGQVEEPEEGDETEGDEEDEGEEQETEGKAETRERDPVTGKFIKAKDEPTETEKPAEQEQQPKGRVPVGELLTERKARQAAEERAAAVESQAQRDIAAMNARLDAILMAQQQRPQEQRQQPEAPQKPDMFADPEGYERWFQGQLEARFTHQRVESSLADAHEQHGEKFVKAYQDLTGINITNAADRSVAGLSRQDPIAQATVQRIMASPNPGRALMNWHSQQLVIREGGTPQFREKVETEAREKLMKDPEFRKAVLADLRAEASGANGGTARTVTRGTRSLNDVSGGTSARDTQSMDDSDEGVFGDIWK